MKKTINLFLMAAIVAAGFTACSDEVDSGGKGQIDENGTPTYATFSLNSLKQTRAYELVEAPDSTATADSKIDPTDLVILIYKSNSGILEKKVQMTSTETTVLVTSGKKKIYVVANYKEMNTAPNDIVSVIDGLSEGTSKMDDLLALKFDANEANQDDFDFSMLHTRTTEGGLPATNDNSIEYDLKSNIRSEEAAAGTPVDNGDSPTNTFKIRLNFMLAKANLYLDNNVEKAGSSSEPGISDVSYTIRNLARYTNIIRKGSGKSVQSYYFNYQYPVVPPSTEPQQSAFDGDFDYTTVIDKVAAKTEPTTYYYVPENNHNMLLRGQSSYFAIKAIFKPNKVVKSVIYNELTKKLEIETDQLANIPVYEGEAPLDYVYTLKEYEGIPAGTYFKHFKLLQIAAWSGENHKKWTNTPEQQAEADILVPVSNVNTDFYQFKEAQSYYRLDIGEDLTGNSLEPGVLRGNYYKVKIGSITGPGYPEEEDLTNKPWEPIVANTYLHATIEPAEWTLVEQVGSLN